MPRVFIFKYKVQEWDLVGNYVLGVLVTWLALPPAAGLPLRGVLAAALLAVGHCCHRCVSKGSSHPVSQHRMLPEAVLWGNELGGIDFMQFLLKVLFFSF